MTKIYSEPITQWPTMEKALELAEDTRRCREAHEAAFDFTGEDQPTTCPHCGARTDYTENEDGSESHSCPCCHYEFTVVL